MRNISGVPLDGVKLSAKANKKVKAYEDAMARYNKHVAENREFAPPKPYSTVRGPQNLKPPALVKAEKELKELDAKALAEGKPLADRDEFLAPVLKRIEEYKRTEPLLKKAMETAEAEAEAAVAEELPALARQAMDDATKAKQEYEKALEAAQMAQAALSGHIRRFMQYVTGGAVSDARFRGLVGQDDKYLYAWDIEGNGKLSYEGAFSLGLVGAGAFNVEMIDLEEFVNPHNEEKTPWEHGHRSLDPRAESTTVWRPGKYNS
ncbi:hypothetical protein GCM10009601_60020 [Streptomyces thermospinosisporus]|uniref:Uncharacterized protein n=1 Tax=Streptomyces thermospinosisporus TaxID=161482 RepID=A0ABP4JZR8_9ACTN